MEYTDLCIARIKQNISPLTTDAVYYVTADTQYRVFHPPLPAGTVLIVTLRGQGQICLNGRHSALNGDTVFVFHADVPFQYRCTNADWIFWWFEFRCMDPGFLPLPTETVLPLSLNDTMLSLCRESLESLKLNDSNASSMFLAALLCLLQKGNREVSQPDNTLRLFQEADRYIHSNPAATVKSAACALSVSERTLLTVFRNLLGISTTEYIRNRKMDMARHLLTTGPTTVQEISELLGYADSFSFSKSFRKHFGISPSEYRKRI